MMQIGKENVQFHEKSFWEFKGKLDYVDQWFLMGSPINATLLLMAYLVIVLKIGPDLMKNRPPYKLNGLLIMYNVAQVCLSFWLFGIGSVYLWRNGIVNPSCPIKKEENERYVTAGIYWYTCAKISEFLDTIFFVLRKKQNQVTFLHVYHHSLMMYATWMTLKYEPTDSGIFLGTLNSLVHVIMYGYYCLSAIPGLQKYLWWKKYITTLQLVQFVLIMIQVAASLTVTECPPSYVLIYLIFFNLVLFLYLFGDFYVKSYLKKQKQDMNNNIIVVEKEKKYKKFNEKTYENGAILTNGVSGSASKRKRTVC